MNFTLEKTPVPAPPGKYTAAMWIAGCGLWAWLKKKKGDMSLLHRPTMLVGPRTVYVGWQVRFHKKYLWLTAAEWPTSFGGLPACCALFVDPLSYTLCLVFLCYSKVSTSYIILLQAYCLLLSVLMFIASEGLGTNYSFKDRCASAQNKTEWQLTKAGQWHIWEKEHLMQLNDIRHFTVKFLSPLLSPCQIMDHKVRRLPILWWDLDVKLQREYLRIKNEKLWL